MKQRKNDSLASVDIQQMERVRLSLQSMLKSNDSLPDDDSVSSKSINLSPGLYLLKVSNVLMSRKS